MRPGRFSDGDHLRLRDGRAGVIQASLGHHAFRALGPPDVTGRVRMGPDPDVGPRYRIWLGSEPVPEMTHRQRIAYEAAGTLVIAQDEDLEVAP